MRTLALLTLLGLVASAALPARAQFAAGLEAAPDELEAFQAAREQKWVRARELATAVVRARPDSFVGHHVLAMAQHEGEANFPVALREAELALDAYARAYGDPPRPGSPWRWHAMMLLERAGIEGDLERHADRLATLDRYNSLYQPPLVAERAWSLMKLRRFDEARLAARDGLGSGDSWQIESALNALCAIEFEAGQYGRSYEACKAALDYGRASPDGPAVVDLTNFAEAARTELELAESEAALREATEVLDGGYGNPWLELGELCLRGARFEDALAALREVPAVRMRRVPSMRDSDRNESMRALAEFYLVVGRHEDALRITTRAVVTPDRRGHNSRDPAIDRAIVALVDHAARRARAGAVLEDVAGGPFFASLGGHVRAASLRTEAWQSGRRLLEFLDEESKLVGLLQIGLASGGITPPWLISDLAGIVGPGVMRSAVAKARAADARPRARAYYDAMDAEAWLLAGDERRAITLARRALASLPNEEGLLRARVSAILGSALHELGRPRDAGRAFEQALLADRSVLRRLDRVLPARVRGGGGAAGDAIVDRLASGPRFDDEGASFSVEVRATGRTATVCLRGPTRGLGCATVERRPRQDDDAFAASVVRGFYDRVLAPDLGIDARVVSALEGPQRSERRPLDTLFDRRDLDVPVSP